MPDKAAERVERAIAEGKAPKREDLETLIAAGRDLSTLQYTLRALSKPRAR